MPRSRPKGAFISSPVKRAIDICRLWRRARHVSLLRAFTCLLGFALQELCFKWGLELCNSFLREDAHFFGDV